MADDFASSVSSLRRSLGAYADSTPLVAAAKGIGKVGEWAQGAMQAADDLMRPATKRTQTDIALPRDKRPVTTPRSLSKGKR